MTNIFIGASSIALFVAIAVIPAMTHADISASSQEACVVALPMYSYTVLDDSADSLVP